MTHCVSHNWKIKEQNIFLFAKQKFPAMQINHIRNTGPDTEDTENTDHGPDISFYKPLVNQSE